MLEKNTKGSGLRHEGRAPCPSHVVRPIFARREDDDRNAVGHGLFGKAGQELIAVYVGHVQVGDDEVRPKRDQAQQGLASIGNGLYLEVVATEISLQEAPKGRIVLHDQQLGMGSRLIRGAPPTACDAPTVGTGKAARFWH